MSRLRFLSLFRRTPRPSDVRAVAHRPVRRSARLELEALEDRQLLSVTISGFVFSDTNNNGIYDPGESPIANNPISLKNSQGAVIASTTTDATGQYVFTTDNTIPTTPKTATYTANFSTTTTNWASTKTIPQFDPSLGTLTSVQISSSGQLNTDFKVESLDNASSTIGVAVNGSLSLSGSNVNLAAALNYQDSFAAAPFDGSLDWNGTSGHDFGPKNASNSKQTTLTAPSDLAAFVGTGTIAYSAGTQAASSTTGSGNLATQVQTSGNALVQVTYTYTPSAALLPGTYTIVETAQPPGYFPGLVSSNGTVIPGSVGQTTISVVLTNNNSSNNNFAKLLPANLSGFVYVDNDGNGVKSAGDTALPNVSIALSGTDYTNAPVSKSLTTDAVGAYSFSGLAPGNYVLTETPPSGLFTGAINPGSQGGIAGNHQITNITLTPGVNGTNNNFGHLPPGSLSGTVYVDSDLNGAFTPGEAGVPNDTIILTGVVNGQLVIKQTTTSATGSYSFNGLAPGTYVLTQAPPAGYFPGTTNVGSLGGSATSGQITSITLSAANSGTGYNFGEILPSNLSGFVYFDGNNNGVFDATEAAIPGISVVLGGSDYLHRAVSVTAVTDADGQYSFTTLLPGTYTIVQIDPPNANFTDGIASVGSLGGAVNGDMFWVNLGQGVQGVNYNFGKLTPSTPIPTPKPTTPGSISGFVYFDANQSGIRDAGDSGIAGCTIWLTGIRQDNGQLVVQSVQTGADGSYQFRNLDAGTYVLTQAPPAGYQSGQINLGNLGGTLSIGLRQVTGIPLTVQNSKVADGISYNFGEVLPPGGNNFGPPTKGILIG